MAYYNANLVIGLTRKALGITQEKLSEDICAVETYSRIENGHHAVRKSTYQKLMKKMGRIAETRYTVCVAEDGVLLEERVELERALKRYDYETAEKYLQKLKEKADDNLLTRQYIARIEALIEYREGRITASKWRDKLKDVMGMTIPEYEEYLDENSVFPFVELELLILMNMGNAYQRMGQMEEALKLYKVVLRCLEARYMGEPNRCTLQIIVLNNLAMVYEAEGENAKALEKINDCIELAAQIDYGHFMETLLSAKAYNIVKLVKKQELVFEYLEEAKKLSRQTYYIAVARGNKKASEAIVKFYRDNLGQWEE